MKRRKHQEGKRRTLDFFCMALRLELLATCTHFNITEQKNYISDYINEECWFFSAKLKTSYFSFCSLFLKPNLLYHAKFLKCCTSFFPKNHSWTSIENNLDNSTQLIFLMITTGSMGKLEKNKSTKVPWLNLIDRNNKDELESIQPTFEITKAMRQTAQKDWTTILIVLYYEKWNEWNLSWKYSQNGLLNGWHFSLVWAVNKKNLHKRKI